MFGVKLSPTAGLIATIIVAVAAGLLASGGEITVKSVLVAIVTAGASLGIRVQKPEGEG